jgi:hypothetical protein
MATSSTRPGPGLRDRMCGDGAVLPTDADGLLSYWQRNGEPSGKLAMSRADFVSNVRTLIDEGHTTEADRRKLAQAFPELDD